MELRQNPNNSAPDEIFKIQRVLKVPFITFAGSDATGYIAVHQDVAGDVEAFFDLAQQLKFPIERVDLAQHPDFLWDDSKMMTAGNTSGFNFRNIAGTNRPSLHGLGRAIDINTCQNPYIRYNPDTLEVIEHTGDQWDPAMPGTLHPNHELVKFMEGLGWEWGGHWLPESGAIDYQHFQKPLASS